MTNNGGIEIYTEHGVVSDVQNDNESESEAKGDNEDSDSNSSMV